MEDPNKNTTKVERYRHLNEYSTIDSSKVCKFYRVMRSDLITLGLPSKILFGVTYVFCISRMQRARKIKLVAAQVYLK